MSLPIAAQVKLAFQKQNRIEAITGLIFGGYVPVAVWMFVHYELNQDRLWMQPKVYFVAAGLVFSLITVFAIARDAFQNVPKAMGFAILVEGAMTMSSNLYLSLAGLAILITINGLSTACNLAVIKVAAKEERKGKIKLVPPTSPTWAAKSKKEVKP